MSKLTIIKLSSADFDKVTIARHIIGLIRALGLREIILEMLQRDS